MVKKDYGTTGGLRGAADFNTSKIVRDNPNDVSYDGKTGWSGGLWASFPLGNTLSLELQLTDWPSNLLLDYTNSLLPDGILTFHPSGTFQNSPW